MSTNTSVGFSQHTDPQEAVLQACVHVKNQLNSAETDLILVFASPQYVLPEIQAIITRTLKPKRLVGSSTGGIILSNGVTNRGIAIIGINSDEIQFGISSSINNDTQDMHYTGFDLARRSIQDLNSTHREIFITFSEGIERDCLPFIRGVKEALGRGFPMIGAVSSDDFKYQKLSQFYQNQILQHSVVGLLLGGSLHLSLGSARGFKPLGKPRTITKVDGYIIRTIDNKPAVDIYKHFLGKEAEGLKNVTLNSYAAMYPLGIYLEESRQYLLRNIIDILEDGSIVCHGGIPQGTEVHLMISNTESCISSAVEAAGLVKESLGDRQAKLILIFEALARHKVLGHHAFNEIRAIKNILGHTTPIIGMCSYGELGPFDTLANIKNVYLHNESILIIAVS